MGPETAGSAAHPHHCHLCSQISAGIWRGGCKCTHIDTWRSLTAWTKEWLQIMYCHTPWEYNSLKLFKNIFKPKSIVVLPFNIFYYVVWLQYTKLTRNYMCGQKVASSLQSSREWGDWGPQDPIEHHNWRRWREDETRPITTLKRRLASRPLTYTHSTLSSESSSTLTRLRNKYQRNGAASVLLDKSSCPNTTGGNTQEPVKQITLSVLTGHLSWRISSQHLVSLGGIIFMILLQHHLEEESCHLL